MLIMLLRAGIRRAEAVALTTGDLVMEQGYHVAIIQHGKGNKRDFAKLPVEVRQVIDVYPAADRTTAPSYAARTRELRLSFARDGARREEGVSLCIIVSLQGGVT